MDLGLQDKVIVVTGGSKGIGAAIVRAIAAEGGIAVFADLDKATGDQLVAEIEQAGGKALCMEKNLRTPIACKEFVDEVLKKFGRIDGLVNNAGGNDSIGLEDGSPEEWMDSLSRNLHHYYFMAHYALSALKKSKGPIVNIGSKTAFTGQGGTSAYAAAKGAQAALTREWAVELAKYSIRVNAVIPAEVLTDMYQNWIDTFPNPKEKLKEIEGRIPLERRMTKASEIADTVLFLLSSRSSHITGQHLFVDGGYTHFDRASSILNDKPDQNPTT